MARVTGVNGRAPAATPFATNKHPSDVLRTIWHNRWGLLLCIVVALVIGFIYIQVTTPVYSSTAKMYLDYSEIPLVNSYQPGRMPQTDLYLQTQAELLKSRPILEAVVAVDEVARMRTFSDIGNRIAYLRKHVRVYVGRRDEIISISFDSPYPIDAAQIVNRLVDAYLASRSDHERRSSAQVLEILKADLARAQEELKQRRDTLQDFLENSMPLALGSEQGGGVFEGLVNYQAAYAQAQTRSVEAESHLEGLQALADDPAALRFYLQGRPETGSRVTPSGERGTLEARMAQIRLERQRLLSDFTPDHPRVTALDAERAWIETALADIDAQFVDDALSAGKRQLAEAKATETQLAQWLEEQRRKVTQASAELAQLDRLQSEVAQSTARYQSIEEQIKDIQRIVGEDVGQMKMEILESAAVAEDPSHPDKAKVMAVAMFLGLLSGGVLVTLRDLLSQKLSSVDEVSASLRLPILGSIPSMSRRQSVQVRGQRVHLRSESPEAEAFRTIRTAVFFGLPDERARTLLITSPSSGDGKSTVASNLAIAMAQAGQKTLLLDADFRRPTQQFIFQIDHEQPGLDAVLARKADVAEAIVPTQIEGLSLLPCGLEMRNPAETLNSPAFAGVLQSLARVYDRVIIDAPPATIVTDAQILGALCDATVLVVRTQKSTRRACQNAVDALDSVGSQILGIVVNDVRRSANRYGYYGTYGGGNGSPRRQGRNARPRDAQPSSDREQLVEALHSEGGT